MRIFHSIPSWILGSKLFQVRTAIHLPSIVALLIALCIAAGVTHAQSSPSHATINFTHDDTNYTYTDPNTGTTQNSGQVLLTINGSETETVNWYAGQAGSYADFIANLAAAINSNSALVSAQVASDGYFDGSGTIVLTSKASGPSTNYSLLLSVSYDTNDLHADPNTGNLVPDFTGPFPVGSAPANMAGGQTIVPAYINPKYRIIGVEYAPPGAASSVSYTGNTTIGHTTDISSSFSSNITQTVSIGSNSFLGFAKGSVTGTSTTSWTQGSSTDKTVTITQSSSITNTVPGPTNSFAGIDHDYDEILLWLNAVVPLSQPFPIITPLEPVTWQGYGFDLTDTTAPNDLDIQRVKVGWLNGDIAIPSDIASVLDRAWAGSPEFSWPSGQGPGLTGPGTDPSSDFGQILQADPFAWCTPISHGVIPTVPTGPGTTGPATCPTSVPIEPNSNRYTQVTNQPLNYTQAAVGTGPNPNTFTQPGFRS